MTREIKQELDAELPDGHVPITFDTDLAIAKGKRTARRRTMLAAGGGTMSVIAIVALVATILTPPATQNQLTGESSQSPVPEPPVELDPDQKYTWDVTTDDGPTQQTVPYHEAFREHMNAHFPDAEIESVNGNVTPLSQADDDDATFIREETSLSELDGEHPDEYGPGETVFERDEFTLTQDYTDGNPDHPLQAPGLSIRFDGSDETLPDKLNLMVAPAGAFALDTDDVIDLAACNTDDRHNLRYSCQTQEASGPNGEIMREVTMEMEDDRHPDVEAGRMVSLVRDDGSGVVVSDETLPVTEDPSDPSLDFDQLSAIALALPESTIE